MPDEVSFWVATVETKNTQSSAFAATPEQALTAFVELWIERHCPASGAEIAYPWELKEDITLGKAVLGQAYMLCNHDQFWFQESMAGDNPRLGATWDALAERYSVFPASLEDASARLRTAFGTLSDAVEADKADFGENRKHVRTIMHQVAALVAEDPATVDHQALVQATENLRTTFDAIRMCAVTEPDPSLREHRREHARRYHVMSFDLTRFSNDIARMRANAPSP